MVREIPVSKGLVTLVDDEDYEWLSQWKWYSADFNGVMYAFRKRRGGGSVYMHREITSAPKGMVVDHLDWDGLNNQKSNLRVVTHAENVTRSRLSRRNTSGYRGVTWLKRDRKWRAQIRDRDGRFKAIGTYSDPAEAARAYDAVAREERGDSAVLNFP